MEEILKQLPQRAKDTHNENKKFFKKLKRKPPKNLDSLMQELHLELIKQIIKEKKKTKIVFIMK